MSTADFDEMGPIDYVVVEFPGSRMTGEGLPLLVDLVDRGIIRILDLLFIQKELDGSVKGLAIADLDSDGDARPGGLRGSSVGNDRRGRHRRGRWCTGARQLGRHPRLREPLGRSVRSGAAPGRRPDGRQRTHSARARARRAGRH